MDERDLVTRRGGERRSHPGGGVEPELHEVLAMVRSRFPHVQITIAPASESVGRPFTPGGLDKAMQRVAHELSAAGGPGRSVIAGIGYRLTLEDIDEATVGTGWTW